MYKAVFNDNYLCHYNKNHSKTNGQFTSGDGDGDGISNDHANQNKKSKKKSGWKNMSKEDKKRAALTVAGLAIGTAGIVAGAIGLGKTIVDTNRIRKLKVSNATAFKPAVDHVKSWEPKSIGTDQKWEKTMSGLKEAVANRNKNPEPKKGSYEYYERLVKGAFTNPYDDYL